MLWVLKRTVSMRQFFCQFEHPKQMLKLMDKKIVQFHAEKFYLSGPMFAFAFNGFIAFC